VPPDSGRLRQRHAVYLLTVRSRRINGAVITEYMSPSMNLWDIDDAMFQSSMIRSMVKSSFIDVKM
jgi:hypothetical protein